MSRRIAALVIMGTSLGAGTAQAQNVSHLGRANHNAHRVYGGVIINTVR